METKKCSKCGRELPVECFGKHNSSKDGLQSYCKECAKQYRAKYNAEHKEEKKQYYQTHKEEILEKQKQYYQGHKEEHSATCKKYYNSNKESILQKNKEYVKKHNTEIKESKKLWYEKNKKEVSKKQMEYYQKNRKQKLEYQKKYNEEHPEKRNKEHRREYDKMRKASLRGYSAMIRSSNLKYDLKRGFFAKDNIPSNYPTLEDYINIIQQVDHYDGKKYPFTKMGADRINNDKPHTLDNIVPCSTKNNIKRGSKTYEEFKRLFS